MKCPNCGFDRILPMYEVCPKCKQPLNASVTTEVPKSEEPQQVPDTKLFAGIFESYPKAMKDSVAFTKNATNKSSLPMDDIRKAANASYPKKSLKALAVAALKIAEVIQDRLPETEVSYMVHPSEFDSSVQKDALPIHFLFKKNGVPKVAVVAVTENGYRTPFVLETAAACEDNGIEYVRVYADGCYADWMESNADSDTLEFCKNWLVQKICNNL